MVNGIFYDCLITKPTKNFDVSHYVLSHCGTPYKDITFFAQRTLVHKSFYIMLKLIVRHIRTVIIKPMISEIRNLGMGLIIIIIVIIIIII